tara:strand:- start:2329 stop:2544 length:216 start_codon:yes stop_codon:yes gene_type:complete
MNAVKFLLVAVLLTAPAGAQEDSYEVCNNTNDSVLCSSEDDSTTGWEFLDNFDTPCDTFYGCGVIHSVFQW